MFGSSSTFGAGTGFGGFTGVKAAEPAGRDQDAGDDGEEAAEEECSAEFKPVVQLDEVEVSTGEEEEEALFDACVVVKGRAFSLSVWWREDVSWDVNSDLGMSSSRHAGMGDWRAVCLGLFWEGTGTWDVDDEEAVVAVMRRPVQLYLFQRTPAPYRDTRSPFLHPSSPPAASRSCTASTRTATSGRSAVWARPAC